jgi:hypothetical protein
VSKYKVTVEIKRPKTPKRPKGPVAPEVRWGPFSKPEDDDPGKPRPELLFYDASARLQLNAINPFFSTEYDEGIMAYMTAYAHMAASNPVQLASADSGTVNEAWRGWLEGSIFKKTDLTYRQAETAWGLPYGHADALDISVKLGFKTTEVKTEQSAWQQGMTPQERLDATPDIPENASLREALQKEIDESDLDVDKICPADIPGPPDWRWYVHDEQDIRPSFATQGLFKSPIGADINTLEFLSDQRFEPFKLRGSQFHVIRAPEDGSIPTYAEALDIPAATPRLEGRNKVRVWLVPRTWKVDLAYTKIYGTRFGSYFPPAAGTSSFLMPAITNTAVMRALIYVDFLNVPQIITRLYSKISLPWDIEGGSLENYLSMCWRVDNCFKFVDSDDDTDLWGRYNATAQIRVHPTPVGRVVGAISTSNTKNYIVYRKVSLEVPEEHEMVYEGPFDSPRYFSSLLVDSEYNNNQMQLSSFETFDPDNAPETVFFSEWLQMTSPDFCPGDGFPYFMELETGLAVHEGLPDT